MTLHEAAETAKGNEMTIEQMARQMRQAEVRKHKNLHPHFIGQATVVTTSDERREGIPSPTRMRVAWDLIWR